jgi:hypothetical protein
MHDIPGSNHARGKLPVEEGSYVLTLSDTCHDGLSQTPQVRELEDEIEALVSGRDHRRQLKELMNKKELVGDLFNNLRLTRQRMLSARGGSAPWDADADAESINATLAQLLMIMERLDLRIGASPGCCCACNARCDAPVGCHRLGTSCTVSLFGCQLQSFPMLRV